MIGAAAFASVIVLALGGLMLVGLDTVGSQGKQLARVAQPELAQAPEVTEESSAEEEQASGKENESSADTGNSEDAAESRDSSGSGNAEQGSKGSEKQGSDEKASGKDDEGSESQASQDKQEKQEKAEGPPPPSDPTMWMSIPRLGMQSDTVYNSELPSTMDVGAIKLPPTGFPWQGGANTYISAHRIGYPGTQSYNQFYALPAMQQNDVVYLADANGTTYEYRVTEKFAVEPWENWVTEPEAGKDMITLQTCVDSTDPNTWWDISSKLMRSGPDSGRLIVQAEKVNTYYS